MTCLVRTTSCSSGAEHLNSNPPSYDVFIDVSHPRCDEAALREHLDRLAHDAGHSGVAGRVTPAASGRESPPRLDCGLDVDAVTGQPAVDALGRAIRMAARARRHLVV